MIERDPKAIRTKYTERHSTLARLASSLEAEIARTLKEARVPHVDRIYFREKGIDSFVAKALALKEDQSGYKYEHPFEEIEDQVAGRVLVFYRSGIEQVLGALGELRKVEQEHRAPKETNAFAYETRHIVCAITPEMMPPGWTDIVDPPTTFELQVRTLAQHAWAEPEHDIYKRRKSGGAIGLSEQSTRKLYWAAATAWGLDSIWEELRIELEALEKQRGAAPS